MAFQGFGRASGPSGPPNSSTPFGTFPRPPPSSPPQQTLQQFPRASEADSIRPANFPNHSAGLSRSTKFPPTWGHEEKYISKGSDAHNNIRPSTVTSFVASRNSGTSLTATITHSQHFKGNRSAPLVYTEDLLSNASPAMTRSPLDLPVNNRPGSQIARSPPAAFVSSRFDEHFPPLGEAPRPALSSAWGGRQKLPSDSSNQLARDGNSYDSGNSAIAHPADLHGQKRSRSPPMQSVSEVIRGNSQSFQDHTTSSMAQPADFNGQKRNRSPPMQSGNEGFQGNSQSFPDYSKRPSMSFLEANTRSNLFSSDSQSHRRFLQTVAKFDVEPAATKPAGFSIPKRTRSPPSVSADQSLQGSSYLSQDDSERETQAKAKRLQRFKTELSETVHISSDIADQKVSAMRSTRSMADREKPFAEISTDSAGDFPNDNVDNEGLESSSVIIGLCPDMCPDSERAERERKGDLDQYERIDGDRNQTSKSLAIKKYTRTAEREANLIRPMPILQKTIDYLLNLLDHPYNDRFLGLYNFLWDRMRAIRMDLRMQHIFNREAITMLEKMIRLHIIAMHELCEYTKGEGFSEGFDAHLNIEQMNKTSVELFQMYDDHRKKGINVPTEKEFRGYYALLKLDKHPGYKVEPAELSLDLAKMTPEIRQTPEVLFARDVARSCRTGNFIAFFRLARKATYLQACLMHAHFSKLRTQALASLHCGVLNNQGLPVAHVANWIGMEEEDIESLIEYHGYVVKEFEELYMVKEGSFLNVDTDYPTKCSKLVHMKKSRSIVNDVLSSCLAASYPVEKSKEIPLGKILNSGQKIFPSVERGSSARADDDMQDFKSLPSPKDSKKVQPIFEPTVTSQPSKAGHQMAGVSHFLSGISFPPSSQGFQPAKVKTVEEPPANVLFKKTPERVMHFGKEQIPSQFVMKTAQPEISPPQIVPRTTQQDRTPSQIVSMRTDQQDRSPSQIVSRTTQQDRSPDVQVSYNPESSTLLSMTGSDVEDEDTPKMNEDDEIIQKQYDEVAKAKLRLILRLWKRRSLRQKELREQRQLAANAALNSLSLGPPVRLTKDQQTTFRDFDIDHVMRERYKKHEISCSRLNVSDVVAPVLSRRNPDAKCLCWKLLVCSHVNNLEEEKLPSNRQGAHLAGGPWLLSKLMPTKIDCDDDDMVLSSPGLSLWKKWIPTSSDSDQTCCLSVIRDTNFDNLNETVLGTNGVLFLVSDHLPWELQKIRLHNLVKSFPPASCLPLLILSSSYCKDVAHPSSFIVKKLGLDEIDKSRVVSYLVGFLVGNQSDGFLSDERLREGLQWLAGESPLQPSLARVQTRDLILTRLTSSLEMCKHDLCPEHCICAFNVALDQTKLQIKRAANTNAACWPCPEVGMLEEFSNEHRAADLYLPSVGWSYAARVEPLVRALCDCKLPNFADVSWLKRGCNGGKEIESQRLELENCLIRYMTETTNMMGLPLAKNEASVMLQKCARLELHNSTYYIVPNWVVIFRRIFNWRLTCFSNKTLSLAYVIEERVSASQEPILDKLELQDRLSAQYHLNHPSFDEMVEVSYNSIIPTTEGSPVITRYVPNDEFENSTESSDMVINEGDSVPVDGGTVINDAYSDENNTGKLVVATKETQKLAQLLEQCNILQNMIDKKLSIYF